MLNLCAINLQSLRSWEIEEGQNEPTGKGGGGETVEKSRQTEEGSACERVVGFVVVQAAAVNVKESCRLKQQTPI